MLDLRGGVAAVQAEFLGDEAVGERVPIGVGVGHVVGVEAAGGAAELGREGHRLELGDGVVQPLQEHGEFLAERDRAGGLAVGPGEHGHVLPPFGQAGEIVPHGLQGGQQHVGRGLGHGQRDGGVVDVLGSQAEVDEFGAVLEAEGGELVLDEVLDRFHIVVGGLFDVLDGLRVGRSEVHINAAEALHLRLGEGGKLGQANGVQGDEVLHLHANAVLDEPGFGEVGRKRGGVAAVPAINGADGVEGGGIGHRRRTVQRTKIRSTTRAPRTFPA